MWAGQVLDGIALDDALLVLDELLAEPAGQTISLGQVGLAVDGEEVVTFSLALEPSLELLDGHLLLLPMLDDLVALHI